MSQGQNPKLGGEVHVSRAKSYPKMSTMPQSIVQTGEHITHGWLLRGLVAMGGRAPCPRAILKPVDTSPPLQISSQGVDDLQSCVVSSVWWQSSW
jgi:hypothetical protein